MTKDGLLLNKYKGQIPERMMLIGVSQMTNGWCTTGMSTPEGALQEYRRMTVEGTLDG